ncbi:phage minor tail protein L [Salinicola sp. CPA57]|uniref:phage minor tail protein L n=1 Tax=Salinicola sp. CPA57 TaxID=1949080 RepID=UPI000DA23D6F|nr:phage minor tail protein L [Salinicola sp. CPA57]
MNNIIATTAQLLTTDAVITLYEIDAKNYGQGVLRFHANSNEVLNFNGYNYTPFPIKSEGFEYNGKGSLPTPTLTVPAQDLAFMSVLIGSNNLEGCDVRRIRTFEKHLDSGSDPDPSATFPVDHFYIDRRSAQTSVSITFELASKLDQQGKQIPNRQCIKNTCTHSYRYWNAETQEFSYENVTCPYAGDEYFDREGNKIIDPAEDTCSKDLVDGCRKRFGNNPLPFRGFPGLQRY